MAFVKECYVNGWHHKDAMEHEKQHVNLLYAPIKRDTITCHYVTVWWYLGHDIKRTLTVSMNERVDEWVSKWGGGGGGGEGACNEWMNEWINCTNKTNIKSFIAKRVNTILVNLRYLRFKLLKYKENNMNICNTSDHNFKNIPLYKMRKVSLERYYFVLYDGALTFKMPKMALNSYCDKILHIGHIGKRK